MSAIAGLHGGGRVHPEAFPCVEIPRRCTATGPKTSPGMFAVVGKATVAEQHQLTDVREVSRLGFVVWVDPLRIPPQASIHLRLGWGSCGSLSFFAILANAWVAYLGYSTSAAEFAPIRQGYSPGDGGVGVAHVFDMVFQFCNSPLESINFTGGHLLLLRIHQHIATLGQGVEKGAGE